MAKRDYKAEIAEESKDMIDKNINFDNRDMHKTWPLVKGCLMLAGVVGLFIFIANYVFRNWASWFG